jgi:hypothetical protein
VNHFHLLLQPAQARHLYRIMAELLEGVDPLGSAPITLVAGIIDVSS